MRILFLPNWKVKKCDEAPEDLQAPDYYAKNEKYWFFKYFKEDVQIDIIDIGTNRTIEKIERTKLHFYPIQSIKAFFKMNNYDIIISHGMPSAIFLALLRRIFHSKRSKHIVFDIGCFNSAAESGKIMKFNQFASKSIDGIICHESMQLDYYKKYYPWLYKKSVFIPFGTDLNYFKRDEENNIEKENYILSIGYSQRDNETMIKAYSQIDTDTKLVIIGIGNKNIGKNIIGIPSIPKRELNKAIQKSKFCILPLEYKNYSFGQMTLLQQMYYRKLVITSAVPSMLDYVVDGKNAILYESKNVKDLKEKIITVLNNNEIQNNIGQTAKECIKMNFNEMNMAAKIEEFIYHIKD